jgi:hypothetical protein
MRVMAICMAIIVGAVAGVVAGAVVSAVGAAAPTALCIGGGAFGVVAGLGVTIALASTKSSSSARRNGSFVGSASSCRRASHSISTGGPVRGTLRPLEDPQRRAALSSSGGVGGDPQRDRVAAQASAGAGGEQRIGRVSGSFGEPAAGGVLVAQHRGRGQSTFSDPAKTGTAQQHPSRGDRRQLRRYAPHVRDQRAEGSDPSTRPTTRRSPPRVSLRDLNPHGVRGGTCALTTRFSLTSP